MSKSLQDQLLKAGLVDKKAVTKAKKEKTKATRAAHKSKTVVEDEIKVAAREAREQAAARNREMAAEQNARAERKAINAQIKQLIEVNKVAQQGETAFNFADGTKIKKIYVSDTVAKHISDGRLAIVKQGDRYELVPRPVAEKIALRDESRIISIAKEQTTEEDDPYADFQIPDDLMW